MGDLRENDKSKNKKILEWERWNDKGIIIVARGGGKDENCNNITGTR